MSYIVSPREVKTLFPGDKGFTFMDNLVEYPRAAIMITEHCPDKYRDIFYTCQAKGWIKPVAYIQTKEYIWEKLKE